MAVPGALLRGVIFAVVVTTVVICNVVICGITLGANNIAGTAFTVTLRRVPVVIPTTFVLRFFIIRGLTAQLTFHFVQPASQPRFVACTVSLVVIYVVYPIVDLVTAILFGRPDFNA